MITTRPFFFILVAVGLGISVFLISDHVVNYETWGDNDEYFSSDFHGFEITCDMNYFAEPTNCKAVDEYGEKIPNEILEKLMLDDECYALENNNILPCRMD